MWGKENDAWPVLLLTSPSAHDKPKKTKKTIVAAKTIDTMVYPRWIWIRKALSRGKYLFNLLLEKVAIEYLLIVKGMSAIWKRMACIEPNSIGGISRFAQYLGAPSGTAFSCCWNLMRAKWAELYRYSISSVEVREHKWVDQNWARQKETHTHPKSPWWLQNESRQGESFSSRCTTTWQNERFCQTRCAA